jgi:hypothetical protein
MPEQMGLFPLGWVIQNTSLLPPSVPLRREYLARYFGAWPGITHFDRLLVRGFIFVFALANGASDYICKLFIQ